MTFRDDRAKKKKLKTVLIFLGYIFNFKTILALNCSFEQEKSINVQNRKIDDLSLSFMT